MAVTVDRFREAYPEFETTQLRLVSTHLSGAAKRINSAVYGDKTDDAVMLLAAHLIAMSPYGENMRLSAKDSALDGAATIYERLLKGMQNELPILPSVLIGVI